MSKRKDRERARSGKIFRDGRLIDKPLTRDELIVGITARQVARLRKAEAANES